MKTVKIDQLIVGTPKPSGADNHALQLESDTTYELTGTVSGGGASEAVKLSNASHVLVNGEGLGAIVGPCVEDLVDVVRGSDVNFVSLYFDGKAKNTFTIKGGVKGWTVINCRGVRKIELGNYCVYDFDGKLGPTTEGAIRTPEDEPKPTVVCFHAEPPNAGPVRLNLWFYRYCQHAHVWIIPKLAVKAYFWARRTFFKERGANAALVPVGA